MWLLCPTSTNFRSKPEILTAPWSMVCSAFYECPVSPDSLCTRGSSKSLIKFVGFTKDVLVEGVCVWWGNSSNSCEYPIIFSLRQRYRKKKWRSWVTQFTNAAWKTEGISFHSYFPVWDQPLHGRHCTDNVEASSLTNKRWTIMVGPRVNVGIFIQVSIPACVNQPLTRVLCALGLWVYANWYDSQ